MILLVLLEKPLVEEGLIELKRVVQVESHTSKLWFTVIATFRDLQPPDETAHIHWGNGNQNMLETCSCHPTRLVYSKIT